MGIPLGLRDSKQKVRKLSKKNGGSVVEPETTRSQNINLRSTTATDWVLEQEPVSSRTLPPFREMYVVSGALSRIKAIFDLRECRFIKLLGDYIDMTIPLEEPIYNIKKVFCDETTRNILLWCHDGRIYILNISASFGLISVTFISPRYFHMEPKHVFFDYTRGSIEVLSVINERHFPTAMTTIPLFNHTPYTTLVLYCPVIGNPVIDGYLENGALTLLFEPGYICHFKHGTPRSNEEIGHFVLDKMYDLRNLLREDEVLRQVWTINSPQRDLIIFIIRTSRKLISLHVRDNVMIPRTVVSYLSDAEVNEDDDTTSQIVINMASKTLFVLNQYSYHMSLQIHEYREENQIWFMSEIFEIKLPGEQPEEFVRYHNAKVFLHGVRHSDYHDDESIVSITSFVSRDDDDDNNHEIGPEQRNPVLSEHEVSSSTNNRVHTDYQITNIKYRNRSRTTW